MTLRRLVLRGLVPLSVFAILATALVFVSTVAPQATDEVTAGTPAVSHERAVPVTDPGSRAPEAPVERPGSGESDDHDHLPATVVAQMPKTDLPTFSMLGVTWTGGLDDAATLVEVRWRSAGQWSDWTDLHIEPSDEGIPGTEPQWVGEADAAEVRVAASSDADPRDLKLVTIDPGTSPTFTPAAIGQPAITMRSGWGAATNSSCDNPRYGATTRGAVIHHTAGTNTYTAAQSKDIVRATQKYHMDGRSWCDIGYNFLVDKYGQIFEGRSGGIDKPVRAAHSGNDAVNQETMGVSLMGTFTSTDPTAAMKDAVVDLVSWRFAQYGLSAKGTYSLGGKTLNRISGHRDVVSTECPGIRVYNWLSASGGLRDRVESTLATGGLATPANYRVTETTATSVTLAWNAVDDAAGYRLWVGTSPTGVSPAMHETTGTTVTINGLTPGTTYYTDIASKDSTGNRSVYTPRISFTTPLAAPSGFTVTADSATSVTASWNAVPGAAKYRVWFGTNAAGTGATMREVTGTSVTITGLTANTTYHLDVAGVTSAGASGTYTNRSSVRTEAPPAFGTPTGFAVAPASATSVAASWNAVPGAAKYRVWYSTNAAGTAATMKETTGTSLTITGLKAGTTYYVDVAAVNSAGTPSVYTPRKAVTPSAGVLPTPTGFTVSSASATSVTASWNAVPGAAKYRVWYGTNANGSKATMREVTGTSVTITGLTAGTTYYVDVAAVNSAGTPSVYTPRASVKPVAAASFGTPAGFTVSAASPTSVAASWNSVSGAAKYRVWYSTNAAGTGATMHETTGTSATITGLKAGTTYYLDVAAIRPDGSRSEYTEPRKPVTTPVGGTFGTPTGFGSTGVTNSSITMGWNAVNGAAKYRVWYGTNANGTKTTMRETTTTSTTITGLASGTTYYLDIAAVRADGSRSEYTPRVQVKTSGGSGAANSITVPASRTIAFKGHGYGHGIGMSQYGAEGGAREGRKYDEILAKYYPGTTLSNKTGNIRVLISADTTSDVVVEARSGITFRNLANNSTIALPTKVGNDTPNRWSIGVYKSDNKQSDLWYRVGSTWKPYQSLRWTGDAQFESSTPLKLQLPSGSLVSYRGALRSARPSSGSTVRDTVNVLNLEDYTRGVVAREMPSSWHAEALKAQSVAARTYGVRLLTPSRYYDACDTTSCQVYGGASAETAATDAAIKATAGKILTHGGATALTQFSSSSGGYTNVGSQPYLQPVADPWDGWSGNANHSWTINVKASTIESKHPSIGTLRSMTVTKRNGYGDMGGRVSSITLTGSKGSKTITGVDARWDFGLRSDWFGF